MWAHLTQQTKLNNFLTWPTVRRPVDVPGQACALWLPVLLPAGGVVAARVRVAGVGHGGLGGLGRRLRRRDPYALVEGVPGVPGLAGADRLVLPHVADGVDAAHVHAGVLALLPDAGLGGGALLVDDALGAALVGLAEEAGLAGAHGPRAADLADGVGAAGVGVARTRGLVSCVKERKNRL